MQLRSWSQGKFSSSTCQQSQATRPLDLPHSWLQIWPRHSGLDFWNGRFMMRVVTPIQTPSITVTTDASGSRGCYSSAFWFEAHKWLQHPWQGSWCKVPIHTNELLPILLAAATWGSHLHNSQILFKCDNTYFPVIRRISLISAYCLVGLNTRC